MRWLVWACVLAREDRGDGREEISSALAPAFTVMYGPFED
jgi:hypothetical protein